MSLFHSNEQGWGPEDPEQITVTWQPAGGNPDGYIETYDVAGGAAVLLGPGNFGGDLSPFDGVGIVRFDQIIIDRDYAPIQGLPRVTLEGPGGRVSYEWQGSRILRRIPRTGVNLC